MIRKDVECLSNNNNYCEMLISSKPRLSSQSYNRGSSAGCYIDSLLMCPRSCILKVLNSHNNGPQVLKPHLNFRSYHYSDLGGRLIATIGGCFTIAMFVHTFLISTTQSVIQRVSPVSSTKLGA